MGKDIMDGETSTSSPYEKVPVELQICRFLVEFLSKRAYEECLEPSQYIESLLQLEIVALPQDERPLPKHSEKELKETFAPIAEETQRLGVTDEEISKMADRVRQESYERKQKGRSR